jgi:hypothetical protein
MEVGISLLFDLISLQFFYSSWIHYNGLKNQIKGAFRAYCIIILIILLFQRKNVIYTTCMFIVMPTF